MERFIEWRLTKGEALRILLSELKWALLNTSGDRAIQALEIGLEQEFLKFCQEHEIR